MGAAGSASGNRHAMREDARPPEGIPWRKAEQRPELSAGVPPRPPMPGERASGARHSLSRLAHARGRDGGQECPGIGGREQVPFEQELDVHGIARLGRAAGKRRDFRDVRGPPFPPKCDIIGKGKGARR